jgi:hypothetical protein
MVGRLKCSTGRWEWEGAKHKRDLQGIERLAIGSFPSYREGRQHMISAFQIPAKFKTYVVSYCCPLQGLYKGCHLSIVIHQQVAYEGNL